MVNDIFIKRKSIILFSDRIVEHEKLVSLFEAARWAPSSFNQQPWRFIVSTKDNKDDYERHLGCLMDGNRLWANNAPVLIAAIAETINPITKELNAYAWHDLGLATASLIFQATFLGLYVHPMGGFYKEKTKKILEIPEGYEPVTMLAVGYQAEKPFKANEELIARENKNRTRIDLTDLVFNGTWKKDFIKTAQKF
jgi:nitroreductase